MRSKRTATPDPPRRGPPGRGVLFCVNRTNAWEVSRAAIPRRFGHPVRESDKSPLSLISYLSEFPRADPRAKSHMAIRGIFRICPIPPRNVRFRTTLPRCPISPVPFGTATLPAILGQFYVGYAMMPLSTTRSQRCARKTRGMSNMPAMTPKEFAVTVGSDGRTVRKFLRSDAGFGKRVGKGQRWTIEAKSVRSLKTKFTKWDAARKPADSDTVTETDDAVEAPISA